MSLQGPLGALPMPAFIQNRRFSVTRQKGLQISDVNPHVKSAQYAVRGELAIKSEQYRAQLLKGEGEDLPFDSVIAANIGNPQQLDQQPITFFRQVASLLENPQLLQNDEVLKNGLGYKSDVIERAKKLLADVKSVGAYSQSQGAPGIRQSVAEFIERRDGYPADPANIYLCAGASSGVNTLMNIICASPKTGVLVPIPQYPLYTATLSLMNAQCVPYYLDEANNWGTDPESIQTALKEAQSKGIDVRAVVVINPGNPTGGSLVPDDIKSVLEMAAQEKLVVLADEVYQSNVFEGEFVSFKKALRDLQRSKQNSEGRFDSVELASLHSISKGMVGECGHRGGYYEMVGFDQEVVAQIYKFVSIMLCAPVIGQCIVELMVNPPREGDPSYELYRQEYDGIYNNLRSRSQALFKAFEQMEGVECQNPQGAMYLFPRIKLPQKAMEAAKNAGKNPDDFYCLEMLDETGICTVPGSGFGQVDGTFHLRTTFLAPGTEWVGRITEFHRKFMDRYR